MNTATRWAAVLVMSALAGSAQATLTSLGNGTFSDTANNITWLSDWNMARGSAFDNGSSATDGRLTWANANNWAASLSFAGFSDWRLATMAEFTAMYNSVGANPTGLNPYVSNWGPTTDFWSADPLTATVARYFFISPYANTLQSNAMSADLGVVAVRTGIGAAAVPEPQSLALVLLALVLLALGSAALATRRRGA